MYLRWAIEQLAARGHAIAVIASPDAMEHPSMTGLAADPRANVQWFSYARPGPVRGSPNLIHREIAYWRSFRRHFAAATRDFEVDTVFVPYLDYFLYAAGLLGSPFGDVPWVGLAMRPSFHHAAMAVRSPTPHFAWAKRRLFFRLLRQPSLRALLTIDESMAAYLADRPSAAKVRFLPSPTVLRSRATRELARSRLGLGSARQILLVYGGLTQRKGIPHLLRAMSDPAFPNTVDVVLAGKLSMPTATELASPAAGQLIAQGRIHVFDRFLDDNEESYAFSAADFVWLGYVRHYGPSGVLAQAGAMGLPVIADDHGLIGWQTRRHDMGLLVNVDDAHGVASAVGHLARDRVLAARLGENGRRAFGEVEVDPAGQVLASVL